VVSATLERVQAIEREQRILRYVVAQARRLLDPDRIWLFGSRARGLATRLSDVDIAFQLPAEAHASWARFVSDTEESLPALAELDLVDVDRCGPELAEEIRRTGQLLYERGYGDAPAR